MEDKVKIIRLEDSCVAYQQEIQQLQDEIAELKSNIRKGKDQ